MLMNSKEHVAWLKKSALMDKSKACAPVMKRVYNECLAAKNEKVLIITDNGTNGYNAAPVLAGSYCLAAREIGLKTNLVVQSEKKSLENASQSVVDGLKEITEGNNIVILCVSNKLGEIKEITKSFRKFMHSTGQKFISTTSLGTIRDEHFHILMEAINIDYKLLQKRQSGVKKILDRASKIHVTTGRGTDIEINVEGKKAISNDGNYRTPGIGGNIPCGEVYIPPKGKDGVDGKVVIDASSRNSLGTKTLKSPITMRIKKGRVTGIEGGKDAELLAKSLSDAEKEAKKPSNVPLIGEFGIGMNPKARITGSMIVDEKVMGTAHVAVGSNSWFGGDIKTIVHFDQVFKNPKIKADNKFIEIDHN